MIVKDMISFIFADESHLNQEGFFYRSVCTRLVRIYADW